MNQRKIGAILSYCSLFVQNLVVVLYTPIMIRLLGQSEYGLYSLAISIVGYLSILDLGLGNSLVRYVTKFRTLNDKDAEYNLNGLFLVFYIFIGILTLITGGIFVSNFEFYFSGSLTVTEIETAKVLFIISTINIALSFPLSIFGSILIAYERFVFQKAMGLVRIILNPCLILPFLYFGHGSITMITIISVTNIACLVINIWYCTNKLKVKLYFKKWDLKLIKEVYQYSFFIFLAVLVDKIYWNTDQVILGVTQGTTTVAVYAVATTFILFYINLTSVIGGLQLPRFTQLVTAGASNDAISNEFIRISRIQFIIGCYVYGGFVYVGKTFIELWAGNEYKDSYYIAVIIMTGLLFGIVQNSAIAVTQAKNMHRFRAIAQLIIAIINIIITIPMALNFGGIGASVATFISFFLGNNIVNTLYYHKRVKLDMINLWKQFSKFIPSFIITFIILLGLNCLDFSESYGEVIFKGSIYTIVFFSLIYFLNMNKFEKDLMKSLLAKLKRKRFN